MNLSWQILLVNELIDENADATIKDFIEALREITDVEIGTVMKMVHEVI